MQPITYGCFYYVLKNNPLYKVLPIVTMGIPPTGLLAIFLLGEEPTKELFIGGIVIIVGVMLIVLVNQKKKLTKFQKGKYSSI